MDDKAKQENRELAKTVGFGEQGLEITNLAQASLVAETLIASRLVPESFNTTAKIIVVAQAAKELGKQLWWGLNNMYVVHGKVGISSAAVAGLIQGSGQCVAWDVGSDGVYPNDDFAIVIKSKRKGFESGCSTEFSIADAKAAGLWTSATWKKYPKQMLTWRATAFHARLYYSDVLAGQYTDAELADVGAPLAAPKCDTAPRAERRKVVSEQTPDKPADSEYHASEFAGVGEVVEVTPTEQAVPAEVKEEATDGTSADLFALYDEVCGMCVDRKMSFVQFAAEQLCRDEDEVDSPEKVTVAMLNQVKVALENMGA